MERWRERVSSFVKCPSVLFFSLASFSSFMRARGDQQKALARLTHGPASSAGQTSREEPRRQTS